MHEETPLAFLRPQVLMHESLSSIDRGSGVRTTPLATLQTGATSFLSGITAIDPGSKVSQHVHNVTELVMVVEGIAVVDIDGKRARLEPFDTTLVPANIPHFFENASPSEPLRIHWVYASVDATRAFTDGGHHRRIDAEHGAKPLSPVREVATIIVDEGAEHRFEEAVRRAVPLFQGAYGARSMSLERSMEEPLKYQLVVTWNTVEDHIERFRSSLAFEQWRQLIADSVSTRPIASNYQTVFTAF